MDHHSDLPLFSRVPCFGPAEIIPFRFVATRTQIELIAHVIRKPGKSSDAYWRAALRHFDQKMADLGISPEHRNRELHRLRDGVQAELIRRADQRVKRRRQPGGDAA